MLDLRRLLLLVDVAEHGSLTGAAAAAGITPSAASQQMSRLEAEVGQPLLYRLPRGVRLTDAERRWSREDRRSGANSVPHKRIWTRSPSSTAVRSGSARSPRPARRCCRWH
ncbi:helix-turn-helix domain-containing protein [Amycolatopsis sp. CA-230715]|uniref:helix-turn-helix domain-containing protein n=1 Tax=Amycolatopsis sp. CA-230715 TaxID=2745196 RepID=UPI001C33923F|nr:LysR family transcriptional regulator [Amycolatopsis sp. CA-230715]QWF76978.1 hypothetical protein HUW46_00358 [Amycolatopsis sp. CA-230715]